jgi:very-short-patch-repair endonuclease
VEPCEDVITRLGGAAKTVELLTAGISERELTDAVRTRRLLRPRKGWYVLPSTPADLIAAVRVGGRATCVTALRVHRIWVTDRPSRVHVAVHRQASRLRSVGDRRRRQVVVRDAVVHWAETARPRRAEGSRLVEPPLAALRDAIGCLRGDDLFASVESALHTGVVSPVAWSRMLETLPSDRRADLEPATALSGSGVESIFVRRIRRLPVRVVVRQQVQIGRDRVDVVIGERLVVELDSRRWHDPAADRARAARLTIAGYAVLRFDYDLVLFDWDTVERAVIASLIRGDHLR